MRILIAIKSCHKDRLAGCHDEILSTWGVKALEEEMSLKFFLGGGESHSAFEVPLDCPDDYDSLPLKTQRICKWSVNEKYDFTFLADTDTFVVPRKLLKTGFEKYDYSGRFGSIPKIGTIFEFTDARGRRMICHPWASGGFGYFLSRSAANIVSLNTFDHWAEDFCVGQIMGSLVQRYAITAADLPNFENVSSWHYPSMQRPYKAYDPSSHWMRDMQKVHG